MANTSEFDYILNGDVTREDSTCVKCDFKGAAFAIPGRIICVCPNCLNGRIDDLIKTGFQIPRWLSVLKEETEEEVYHQLVHDEFNIRFYKCIDCNKIIIFDDTRWYFEPGERTSSPRCMDCYNKKTER